jgi:hypothetical protein
LVTPVDWKIKYLFPILKKIQDTRISFIGKEEYNITVSGLSGHGIIPDKFFRFLF